VPRTWPSSPSDAVPLQGLLPGRSQPPGHAERVWKAAESQPSAAVKMLKATLRQPCLRSQPGRPVPGEAVPSPCDTEGDTRGDTGCQQQRGSAGGPRCRQLRDAPATKTGKQEGWTGLAGGKASRSCRREPGGLSGDVLGPWLDGSNVASVPEPTAPPKCPGSAPELPPAAASPSQEWKVVKIQRVLINPTSELRKTGKRNPLGPPPCSPKASAVIPLPGLPLPGTAVGTPGPSHGRTSAGLEVPGSRPSRWDFFSLR